MYFFLLVPYQIVLFELGFNVQNGYYMFISLKSKNFNRQIQTYLKWLQHLKWSWQNFPLYTREQKNVIKQPSFTSWKQVYIIKIIKPSFGPNYVQQCKEVNGDLLTRQKRYVNQLMGISRSISSTSWPRGLSV